MGRKFGFSFSAKRALGISAAKARISRKVGIPLTRAGRQRKFGKAAGCCVPLALCAGTVASLIAVATFPVAASADPPAAPPASPSPAQQPAPPAQTDFSVNFGDGQIGPVLVEGITGKRLAEGPYVRIFLRINNTTATTKLSYKTWRGDLADLDTAPAVLKDEFGNVYRRINFGIGERPFGSSADDESIYPGKFCIDALVFEPPIDAASKLTLYLPRAALGHRGVIEVPLVRDGNKLVMKKAPAPPTPPPPPKPPPRAYDGNPISPGETVRAGAVTIRVGTPRSGKATLVDGKTERKSNFTALMIPVTFTNAGAVDAKPIAFASPVFNEDSEPKPGFATLTSDSGRSFRAKRVQKAWWVKGTDSTIASLAPGKSTTVVFLFEPAAGASSNGALTLRVPLACVSDVGDVQLRFTPTQVEPAESD